MKESLSQNEKEPQLLEGVILNIKEGEWQKFLPEGVTEDMVDRFIGNDGAWHWHLHPDEINDPEESERYRKVRNMWPRG